MPISSLQPINYASMVQVPDFGAQSQAAVQQGQQQRVQDVQLAQQQAQIARALQQQKNLDDAKARYIQSPTPEAARALATLDPTGFNAIKDQHAMQTSDVQNQNLRDLTAIYSHLGAGNAAAATTVLQNRITADKKAGQDTTDDEQMLAQIQSDPHGAKNTALATIGAVLGPDKFADFYKTTGQEERANAAAPGELAKTAADTALATANAGKATQEIERLKNPLPQTEAVSGVTDANGNPIFYDKTKPPPVGSAAGVTPDLDAFTTKLIGTENSTGNPSAKNPRSSATGNGQFLGGAGGAWMTLMRANHPDLVQGKTDEQVLAMRSDPKLSRTITAEYAQQNAQFLATAGPNGTPLPVNGATLAMAHKLGPGGAQSVLGADPSTPLDKVLPPNVMAANPQLKGQTAGSYASGLAHQFGVNPISTANDPTATGDDYLKTLAPTRARLIKGIADGDLPMPTGRSISSGSGQALMQQVLQYDPTASAINLDSRKKTREKFTSGTEGQAINSVNTVTGHLVGLDHAIERLGSTPLGWVNAPAQFVERAAGNKDMQSAVANFNFYKVAVANELTKVFRGSNGAEADVQAWLKQLDSAKSPTELHATVRSMVDGMQSRVEALTNQYSVGMGRVYDTVPGISPHTKTLLASLRGDSTASTTQPTVAVNPKTGERVVYDPAAQAWKPG